MSFASTIQLLFRLSFMVKPSITTH